MAVVYSETTDGYIGNLTATDAATCRGDASTSGTISNFTGRSARSGVYVVKSSKGAGAWIIQRSYFVFDLSEEDGTVDSCTLEVYMDNTSNAALSTNEKKVIPVEATALAGNASDYGNCFSSGSTLGTALGPERTVSGVAGYQGFSMTGDTSSGGIKVINDAVGTGGAGGIVTICLMDHYWDYEDRDIEATHGSDKPAQHAVTFANNIATTRDPKLDITYVAVTVTDNATFFGANF